MDPEDGTSPHLRFSQRYKSGLAKASQYQQQQQPLNTNVNTSSSEIKCDVSAKSLKSGRVFPPTYRNLYTTSSLQDYLKSQENSEWESVQSTVIKLFQKKSLGVRQLYSLRENVKNLWSTNGIGPILFDFYLKQVLSGGVAEIRHRLMNLKDDELIRSIESNWFYFYSEVVPTLQAIFFPLNPRHTTLRHAVLVCFRDNVILKINFKEALESISSPPSAGIKHMMLILQSIHDTYPPSDNYLAFERLVAKVVSPYMGYRGIYEGGPDPILRSKEPEIHRWKAYKFRQPIQNRPLITNPNRAMDTLEEMFHSVYSKENGEE